MGLLDKLTAWINPKDEAVLAARPARNEDCWCGSGKKYKKCHLDADTAKLSKTCSADCKTT